MCIDDGVLRAKLDGELAEEDALAAEQHLATCARCRARADELEARARDVGALFSGLAPAPGAVPADADAAYARFQARRRAAAERRAWTPWLKPVWAVGAAAVMVALLVSSGPTRALAQRLLGLLRVRSVVVVPTDRSLLDPGKGKMLGDLLADSVTVTKNEPARVAATREIASSTAGFTVRLPAQRQDPPQLVVEGEHAVTMTVKMERVKAMLSILGRPDLEVPENLAGAKVAVDVPRGVRATYGNCPQERGSAKGMDLSDCVVLIQVPTPTVVTVPELDLSQIAQLGLQLTGMTPQQAEEFSRSVDWTSTLAVPVPRGEANFESIRISGTPATLITSKGNERRPAGWVLIWIKDGMVYSMAGFSNPGLAVPLAESLG